jgi:hypothetical protein
MNNSLPCGCSKKCLDKICKEIANISESELIDITKTKWYKNQKKSKK